MSSSPFQALVFDLGGVVVEHDNAVLFERLASRCRPSWTPEEVVSLFRQSRWGTGTPIRLFHQQLAEAGGYRASWDVFVEDWSCHLAVNPSMLAVMERLARRNRVMIFSNTNQEHWDFVLKESGGVLAGFEPYLSHEIGHEKPSLRAFQVVAEKAGIDPANSIFFDDLPANVEGARQAGFEAEVFLGEPWLLSFLEGRGVALG
ncbi:HAD-IA family hydrolase [Labrys sp. ZIDIC5]|uniref:HAD-IA family hydrolase n=1 Tax=Labrys sedimenti TaxID=3106036 RepID=UPI002ACA9E63|nr:HAD-IA family hydrolase [Labrys sp. ZIDIC5]MDZ5451775.1 HAD-IA family hydrolase [Labrys sp. ZIDIC5]